MMTREKTAESTQKPILERMQGDKINPNQCCPDDEITSV
jgi:hypothetical protein